VSIILFYEYQQNKKKLLSAAPEDVEKIRSTVDHLATYTCVRFVPRSNQRDYVHIIRDKGCHSNLGRIGGEQQVSLGEGCVYTGTILHEFIHVLGYTHMHNHIDRDEYIDIKWDNIKETKKHNFEKVNTEEFGDFGTKFDYYSVMLYPPTAFSVNGENTIVSKDFFSSFMRYIGQRKSLSSGDQTRINTMYGCPEPKSSWRTLLSYLG
jgi:Astacin (Peptidase family M12A)